MASASPLFQETAMNSAQTQTLPAQGILTLRKPSALQLRVLSGCVWLTESRDPTDHFLQAGDSFFLHTERVVIEAQEDSLIVWTPTANTPFARARRREATAKGRAQVPGMAATWRQLGPAPLFGLFQRPFKG
jgi:hypothetical protein